MSVSKPHSPHESSNEVSEFLVAKFISQCISKQNILEVWLTPLPHTDTNCLTHALKDDTHTLNDDTENTDVYNTV